MLRTAFGLSWLLIGTYCCSPAWATKQFPPTVVREKDGKWQLASGYLGGWGISVVGGKMDGRGAATKP